MDATVQLNVRMARDLRDAGNATLEGRGVSPSEFVRAAWNKLAARGEGLEALLAAVFSEANEPAQPDDPFIRGQLLYDEALAAAGGLRASDAVDERPFSEMMEGALLERWDERELSHGR